MRQKNRVLLPYLGCSCLILAFHTWKFKIIYTSMCENYQFSTLQPPFLKDTMLQAYSYFHGKCPNELYSLVPLAQIFTTKSTIYSPYPYHLNFQLLLTFMSYNLFNHLLYWKVLGLCNMWVLVKNMICNF